MKTKIRKLLSFILVASLLIGFCPDMAREAKAATAAVRLANLGSLGSLSVGSKTKSGSWWKMYVGGSAAFCMNLGYTCHTGDVYQDSSATYTSSSSGKKGLKACIGYWYAETMNHSNKAFVMAQALFWAVEEGDTSETKLKNVISKIKSNTGYFGSKTAADLHKQIFSPSGTITVQVREYKYAGSGSHRQELLVIDAGTQPTYKKIMQNIYYRQRIRIRKVDEDGNPMTGAKFEIEAENIDELYSYSVNGDSGATEKDMDDFTVVEDTDADGWISLRLTYHIYSDEYYYVPDDELDDLDSNAKKTLKDDLDDKGYKYASDLTKDSAETKVAQDIMAQYDKVKNKYRIAEKDSGNKNIIINPDYQGNGKTITLDDDYIWTNVTQVGGPTKDWAAVEEKPYDLKIVDNYKKVGLKVLKVDDYSTDKKAHGDASLDGAVFGIYDNQACTVKSTFYTKDGKKNQNNQFTIKNGSFETGFLRCGKTYYVKEITAPEGYLLKTDVKKITLDGKNYPEVEYVPTAETLEVEETPILGKIGIYKYTSEGKTGDIHPEEGAVFQVYLKDAGSYDNANANYERDTLTIDKKGYACTKDLYYGDYWIHQVSSGDKDTEKVADKLVRIEEPNRTEPIDFYMENQLFKAYLRVIKKDGTTKKDVLKGGTTYQIYSVDKDGKETLIKQTNNTGNKKETVDTFVTDETGQIMTYEALPSGTYRIYETDAATGYHISTPYIEIVINSMADNYTTETDVNGNTYTVVEAEYTNDEAYGKLSISKTGELLSDYRDGQFIYEETQLEGAEFEIYAAEDIMTQDNQGTRWFEKDDLVGTVTTGKGAAFESECGGLTDYDVSEDGIVTVNLPLGKYRVTEKKTLYGYILPEEDWEVEFTWDNKDDVYVLNATDATDENGILNAVNQRAKPQIDLIKTDADSNIAVPGAVFGLYTKDAIYNAKGEKIVDAGECLGSLVTDKGGKAETDLDLPLMSEEYGKKAEVATGSAVAVSGSAVAGVEEEGLNSGDYFLKEELVSRSYYLDQRELPVHLEYKDMQTAVIHQSVTMTNRQTVVEIDKRSATDSEEIPGCELVITDKEGKEIIKWTSGDEDSVVTGLLLDQSGYQNISYRMDENGNLIVNGLLQETEYMLTETRPADGFATADSISFMLRESKDIKGDSVTVVALKNEAGEYVNRTDHTVTMVDETTKIRLIKVAKDTGKKLSGAKFEVYDSNGEKVMSFTSKKTGYDITGKLKVGETYTFKEVKAPKGYELAKPVKYKIKDTGKVQKISVKDSKYGKIRTNTPGNFTENSRTGTSPKTGYMILLITLLSVMFAGSGASIYTWRKYYGKKIRK